MCCGIRGISLFHSHYRNINSSEVVTVTLLHIRDQDHLVLDYFPDQTPTTTTTIRVSFWPRHWWRFLTGGLFLNPAVTLKHLQPCNIECGVNWLQSVNVHLQSDLHERRSCKLANESRTDTLWMEDMDEIKQSYLENIFGKLNLHCFTMFCPVN